MTKDWNGPGDRLNATVVGFRCFNPNHNPPILQQLHRPSNPSQQCQAASASASPVSNVFFTHLLSLTSLSFCRKMYRRYWWKQGHWIRPQQGRCSSRSKCRDYLQVQRTHIVNQVSDHFVVQRSSKDAPDVAEKLSKEFNVKSKVFGRLHALPQLS